MESIRIGNLLLTFDGQIVEIFGWMQRVIAMSEGPSARFHVELLAIEVDTPDRKGNRRVTFKIPEKGPSVDLLLQEADYAAIEPFLAKVSAAIGAS